MPSTPRLWACLALASGLLLLACTGGNEAEPGASATPDDAATRTLEAVADTTIYAEAGDRSNGAGDSIFAGGNDGGAARRALLRFDLAALSPGAVVASATLTLHLDRTAVGPQLATVHRLLASWGEGGSRPSGPGGAGATAEPGDATWTDRSFGETAWAEPGGEFTRAASASLSVDGNGRYSWTDPGLLADVQAWLQDPATNFGWIVLAESSERRSAKRFASRSHPDVRLRPTLTIEVAPAE